MLLLLTHKCSTYILSETCELKKCDFRIFTLLILFKYTWASSLCQNKRISSSGLAHLIWQELIMHISFQLYVKRSQTVSSKLVMGEALSHQNLQVAGIRAFFQCQFLNVYQHIDVSQHSNLSESLTQRAETSLMHVYWINGQERGG